MTPRDDRRLMTRDEVDATYGISRRFLETAIYRDDGPALVRVGRLVRYRPTDIEAWLEENTFPKEAGK